MKKLILKALNIWGMDKWAHFLGAAFLMSISFYGYFPVGTWFPVAAYFAIMGIEVLKECFIDDHIDMLDMMVTFCGCLFSLMLNLMLGYNIYL